MMGNFLRRCTTLKVSNHCLQRYASVPNAQNVTLINT